MKYTDWQRIQKICEYAEKLDQYIKEHHVMREDVLVDDAMHWLVTTPLYNIGEQAYCLSDAYKAQHPEIPWPMLAGLRHRLVHDYEGTNWNVIVDVVFEEIPILLKQLKEMET
jgi:uncharacterized protein with HEPN domain